MHFSNCGNISSNQPESLAWGSQPRQKLGEGHRLYRSNTFSIFFHTCTQQYLLDSRPAWLFSGRSRSLKHRAKKPQQCDIRWLFNRTATREKISKVISVLSVCVRLAFEIFISFLLRYLEKYSFYLLVWFCLFMQKILPETLLNRFLPFVDFFRCPPRVTGWQNNPPIINDIGCFSKDFSGSYRYSSLWMFWRQLKGDHQDF